jgi:predicted N-acetyltransferase YhbS
MADLLVRLYDLDRYRERCRCPEGFSLRTARAFEASAVTGFVRRHFGVRWADEAGVCFAHQPIGCVVAVRDARLAGFACFDATLRGFFGPVGVLPSVRRQGLGRALAWAALDGLRGAGYGYAIVGGAGEAGGFYERWVGALRIPESDPGIYGDRLAEAPDGPPP